MRRASRLPVMLTGIALLAAACGDGPTTATTGDPLTEVEVQELAAEIFASLSGYLSGDFSAQANALLPTGLSLSGAASVPINISIDESGPCGGEGTSAVHGSIEGNVDDQSGEGHLEFDITQTFDDCLVEGEVRSYTVSGEPNLRLTGDFESDGEASLSGTFRLRGGFAFTVDDGRSGTCGVDASVTIEITQSGFSGSSAGTMCGVSVSSTISFGD